LLTSAAKSSNLAALPRARTAGLAAPPSPTPSLATAIAFSATLAPNNKKNVVKTQVKGASPYWTSENMRFKSTA